METQDHVITHADKNEKAFQSVKLIKNIQKDLSRGRRSW